MTIEACQAAIDAALEVNAWATITIGVVALVVGAVLGRWKG